MRLNGEKMDKGRFSNATAEPSFFYLYKGANMGNYAGKLLLGILTAGICLFLGCQGSNKNIERHEKLQAHARYQLSGELEQKDKEIERLTVQITDLKKQLAEQTKFAEDCTTKAGTEFMTMIDPIMEELTQVKAENEQLKAQLQELNNKTE